MDYEKLHKDTIAKLQEMVNSGKITVEIARGICADFAPESEDERMRKVLMQNLKERFGTKGNMGEGLDMSDVLAWFEKQGEKNSAWSEEDAKVLNRISEILVEASEVKNWWKEYRLIEREEMIRLTDFLKSLRPQTQWKPSKEQIKGIECAIKTLQHQLNVRDKRLNSLYDDLKQLMEE